MKHKRTIPRRVTQTLRNTPRYGKKLGFDPKAKPVTLPSLRPYPQIMDEGDELALLRLQYKHAVSALKAITHMTHLTAVHRLTQNTLEFLHES